MGASKILIEIFKTAAKKEFDDFTDFVIMARNGRKRAGAIYIQQEELDVFLYLSTRKKNEWILAAWSAAQESKSADGNQD